MMLEVDLVKFANSGSSCEYYYEELNILANLWPILLYENVELEYFPNLLDNCAIFLQTLIIPTVRMAQ